MGQETTFVDDRGEMRPLSDLRDISIYLEDIEAGNIRKSICPNCHFLAEGNSSSSESEEHMMEQIDYIEATRNATTAGPQKRVKSIANFQSQTRMTNRMLQRRILIVDDEPYNLIGLKIILNAADKRGVLKGLIDEAVNGEEAYKKVKEGF
jgi:hypothetical protein